MFKRSQKHSTITHSNNAKGMIFSAAAIAAILGAGTLAVSAQTPSKQQGQQIVLASAQSPFGELRMSINETSAQPRRQVRVIPLFNTPVNPTGFEGK